MNGYLYLATDGVEDYKKFGITTNLDIRLVNYNSSQHIRPVFFEKTYVFDTYSSARNAETKLKNKLKNFIKQTYHLETFEWNEESKEIFLKTSQKFKEIEFKNNFAGKVKNEKFPFYKKVIDLIDFAISNKLSIFVIENLIVKNRVGYYKENTPKRVILENRVKHLIKLTEKPLYWDNKPRLLDRMERYYRLEQDINKELQTTK